MPGLDDAHPNVLVVLTDQQRWDTVGAYGSPRGLTPTLDRMAADGTRLERTFTPQPVCGPARGCLQTGQHATDHGVWKNGIPLEADSTLATTFSEAGYDVGYAGKWHLAGGGEIGDGPIPPERRAGYDGFFRGVEHTAAASDPDGGHVYDEHGNHVEFDQYRVDAFTDFALEFIRQERETPFFCFLSIFEPHDQPLDDNYDTFEYAAPDGYAERYADAAVPGDLNQGEGNWEEHLAGYYGMCRRIDENLQRLLDTLEAQGVRDETVVLFTSDHGCHFDTRDGENKRTCHESSIRVPAVLSGPGFDGGHTVEELVSLLDVPPTLLDAAGLDAPETMAGRSVRPLVAGSETEAQVSRKDWRDEVFIQTSETEIGRALRTDRWTYCVRDPDAVPWLSARESPDSDTYVESHLYDLDSDPHQQTNLVGNSEYREVADDLRERLLKQIRAVEAYSPAIRRRTEPPS